jgi:type IV secretory pathway VirJ component
VRALLTVLLLLVGIGKVSADAPFSDLPLNVTEPKGPAKGVVILWSGDGGWSSTMQGFADALAARGFGVVGISSLRYFWYEQAPEVMAADNERLVAHFSELWQTDTIILAGYSFGADMLPFAWPLMQPETRQKTDLIALLSPFPKTEFRITFLGMLGIIRGSNDVASAIAALPADRVFCLIGEEETDMACAPSSEFDFVQVPGGHSYNGDAALIADRLIGAL